MEQEIIEAAAKTADVFISSYYKTLDENRQDAAKFYSPQCVFLWNGNPLSGQNLVAQFIQAMPKPAHEILGYDAQPMVLPHGINILLQVTGTVKHDDHPLKSFSQTFILTKDLQGNCNTR